MDAMTTLVTEHLDRGSVEKCHQLAHEMADRLGGPRARRQGEVTATGAADGDEAE